MLDLSQKKLTRAEWNGIEAALTASDMQVIRLLSESSGNPDLRIPIAQPLSQSLKIEGHDGLIFERYLLSPWNAVAKQLVFIHGTSPKAPQHIEKTVKKAEIIKFNNSRLTASPDCIIEFVVLALFRSALRKKKKRDNHWLVSYFTACHLYRTAFDNANAVISGLISQLIDIVDRELTPSDAVLDSVAILEENILLTKYAPLELYPHQKELVSLLKSSDQTPLLITYTAPTGTGKTLSPLGLLGNKAVIFMCAARHIGLALARAAVSAGNPIAFAFGCESEDDVRLHYSAAKYYTRNTRTGGIRKVDNLAGMKVELMVCDMKSYTIAMNYMLKYREATDIVWYWDEPTMTLDSDSHPCHSLIAHNWAANIIPSVVLSSATLPSQASMVPISDAFCETFPGARIERISSHDCKKTITLISKAGFAQSPHAVFTDAACIRSAASVCKRNPTLLRYVDLAEVVAFIAQAWTGLDVESLLPRLRPRARFPSLTSITMESVKGYYLDLILTLPDSELVTTAARLAVSRTPRHDSTVYASSSDAHTLTDGPTMFMCDDTSKVGKFLLQEAKVPQHELQKITARLAKNDKLNDRIGVLEHKLADLTASDCAAGNEKRLGDAKRGGEEVAKVRAEIATLSLEIKSVSIDTKYVPNKPLHLRQYGVNPDSSRAFANSLCEEDLLQILNLANVGLHEKLLLMLGIGVFDSDSAPRYLELMKRFATEQKLYLIVASTDYTYGTNYQFCHGYVGSGLTKSMSREKSIQAFGRVGRGKCQHSYSIRVRDDGIIARLFDESAETPELDNMIRLLS